MDYFFDTNIALHFIRETELKTRVEQTFDPFKPGNRPLMSAVTIGELKSIAIQNQWGAKKLQKLADFELEFVVLDINFRPILDRYAEIDAFSQGKLASQPGSFSARNMGKNDLWIAATAAVSNARLLTTDSNFAHLDGLFLQVLFLSMD